MLIFFFDNDRDGHLYQTDRLTQTNDTDIEPVTFSEDTSEAVLTFKSC